jgi:4-amino-4-deoxy-L-arabinose transferase-like glycosyltransferase
MKPATIAWLAALLGCTALLSCYDLGGGARFEPTDCWVAQTAREMYAGKLTRDLIVPKFSGETRMQKSPGPYWAVLLTAALRGQPDIDEVATRIPSALAALLIVGTVFWFTRRVAGDRAAIFAGFACSASALTLYWSHRGASDLGLAALTTLSLALAWVAAEQQPRGPKNTVLCLLAYFAAGLGMLYKLPMPLAIVGVPVALYIVLKRRWRVLARPIHLVGLLVFLLPWVPWVFAVLYFEPTALAKWRVEFLDRFTGDLPNVEGQRQWYWHFFYLAPPLYYCLPFSGSLPQALARVLRPPPGVNRDGLHFAGLWFAGLLVFFTVAAGKEERYLLPALPPLFVLLGIELARFFDPQRPVNARWERRAARGIQILLPLGFAAGVFGTYAWYKQVGQAQGFAFAQVWQPYVVCAVIFTAGAYFATAFYRRRQRNAAFGVAVATMWVTWLWAWPTLGPVLVSQRPFLDFSAQLRAKLDPELLTHVRQIGSQDARIIWYSDYRFPRIIDQLELLRRQQGRRSLRREVELVGEELVNRLAADELALFIAARSDYVTFLLEAPRRLAELGRQMPAAHLWLQTHVGPKNQHFVLFGNRPPPWPEPNLKPPSDRMEIAQALGELPSVRADTAPASATSTPSSQGS